MSLAIITTSPALSRLNRRMREFSRTLSKAGARSLLDAVGAIVESQTRRRIADEKTSPAGKPWDDWSEAYAASKHGADDAHDAHPGELRESGGHSLLVLDGGLLDSVQFLVTGEEVEVGSNLKYARRQNAARPFLGLSKDNEREVVEIIDDFLDDQIKRGLE